MDSVLLFFSDGVEESGRWSKGGVGGRPCREPQGSTFRSFADSEFRGDPLVEGSGRESGVERSTGATSLRGPGVEGTWAAHHAEPPWF